MLEERSSQEREAVLAALNGLMGDYLAATGNPLAIPMRLRRNANHGYSKRSPCRPRFQRHATSSFC
jgi:hypothetical protein